MPSSEHVRSRSTFEWPAGLRGAVSLTFDDARASQLDAGIPLFDDRRVRATFYALPCGVEARSSDWRRAVDAGHELGGHTLSHPCSCNFPFAGEHSLEGMTLDWMERELVESNARIEALIGVCPVSFAYPCGQKFVGRGAQLQSYVPLVARHYRTGRGWRDEYLNVPECCDLAQLGGMSMDDAEFSQLRPLLENAARSGAWLVLAGHDVGARPGSQTVPLATLEAICDYCRDPANGLWLDTVGLIGGYVRQTRGF